MENDTRSKIIGDWQVDCVGMIILICVLLYWLVMAEQWVIEIVIGLNVK